MQGNFEYLIERVAQDSFYIEDTGNICLRGMNDDGLGYYLVIQTDLGSTSVSEFGPFLEVDENQDLFNEFNYHYERFDYNEKKISKIIKNFLNNYKYKITQVDEIAAEEAAERFRGLNIEDYIEDASQRIFG